MTRKDGLVVDILSGVVVTSLVLYLCGTLAHHTEPVVVPQRSGFTANQQEKIDKIAAASLFGQFRSSMADFLWLKVDKYMHNGVELRGLTDYEKNSNNADGVHTSKADVARGYSQHEGETTTIPSAQKDWRGVLGNIEREVQPYKDMRNHTHRDPKEALPLFRLMTATNPNFVPGYVTGAAMIAMDSTKIDQALAFLQEGEANNPTSLEIKAALGMFYVSKKREYAMSIRPLEESIALASKRDSKTMTDDELDAWEDSYRWLVLAYRYMGDRQNGHKIAVAGLKLFPLDVTCRKQMEIEQNNGWDGYIDKAYVARTKGNATVSPK